VVIPCLNEGSVIGDVVRQVRQHWPGVIAVDDGSTDDTAARAEEAGALVVRHPANLGKGAALKTGLQEARRQGANWAVTMDGDGQHRAEDIPGLLQCAAGTGAALVIGDRMGGAQAMPWVRRRVNHWLSRRLSRRAGRALPDTQCGLRLLDLRVWETLRLETSHFEAESETLMALLAAGARVEFVPVQVVPGSGRSHIRPLVDVWRWWRWWRRGTPAGRPAVGSASGWRSRLRGIGLKLARMFVAGLILGWAYTWAAPMVYRAGSMPGFWLGTAHGALMPVALPSLLMGQDVPIYAERNTGRTYKLGYIAGINACGLFFFGFSFWQPARGFTGDRPRPIA
jgi:polyprenyl-phospho-N-acetylgalactosaminyl synthase